MMGNDGAARFRKCVKNDSFRKLKGLVMNICEMEGWDVIVINDIICPDTSVGPASSNCLLLCLVWRAKKKFFFHQNVLIPVANAL